jgi:hypothetical protein
MVKVFVRIVQEPRATLAVLRVPAHGKMMSTTGNPASADRALTLAKPSIVWKPLANAATVHLLIKLNTRTLIASLPDPVLLSQPSVVPTPQLPSPARLLQNSLSTLTSLVIWASRRARSLLLSRRPITPMIGGQAGLVQGKESFPGKSSSLFELFIGTNMICSNYVELT